MLELFKLEKEKFEFHLHNKKHAREESEYEWADEIPRPFALEIIPLRDRMEFSFWNGAISGFVISLVFVRMNTSNAFTARKLMYKSFWKCIVPTAIFGTISSSILHYSIRLESISESFPQKFKDIYDKKHNISEGLEYVVSSRKRLLSHHEYYKKDQEYKEIYEKERMERQNKDFEERKLRMQQKLNAIK